MNQALASTKFVKFQDVCMLTPGSSSFLHPPHPEVFQEELQAGQAAGAKTVSRSFGWDEPWDSGAHRLGMIWQFWLFEQETVFK